MSRQGKTPRRRGAPVGNRNAEKSGLYRSITAPIDGRSREARAIRKFEDLLLASLGDTSPQEQVLCHTIAVAVWRMSVAEKLMLESPEAFSRLDDMYSRWSGIAMKALVAVGLKSRGSTETLQDYLQRMKQESD